MGKMSPISPTGKMADTSKDGLLLGGGIRGGMRGGMRERILMLS